MLSSLEIKKILQHHQIEESIVFLHSSLRSFGPVEKGPYSIIEGLLMPKNTLLVPTYFYDADVPPPSKNYIQNGIDYQKMTFQPKAFLDRIDQIDPAMGIIPKVLLTYPQAYRGKHPCAAFAAIGPLAEELIGLQSNLNVFGIYRFIHRQNRKAYILLAGVDLVSCSPIHYAEELAGKQLFRRWVLHHEQVVEVETGSCSRGFNKLKAVVEPLEKKIKIGNSTVFVYLFVEFVELVANYLRDHTAATVCGHTNCLRCKDLALGGPILTK